MGTRVRGKGTPLCFLLLLLWFPQPLPLRAVPPAFVIPVKGTWYFSQEW